MYVEIQKRAAQSALRRTRICGDAERLDFSSDFSAHLAIDVFDVHLVIRFGFYHLARTRQRVFTGEPSSGDVLLRALSGGNYRTNYRVAGRSHSTPGIGLNNVGFRCVRDIDDIAW